MDSEKIIYSINVEDIETVADQIFDRKPTIEEIKFVERKIGESISWFDLIQELLENFQSAESENEN